MAFFKFLFITLAFSRSTVDIVAIQNGENATDLIKQFPYIGSYHVKIDCCAAPTGERVCTGIIVNQNAAITAGRCLIYDDTVVKYTKIDVKKNVPYFVMGVSDWSLTTDPNFVKRDITEIIIPRSAAYGLKWPFDAQNDIGAIKWTDQIAYNAVIQKPPFLKETWDGEDVGAFNMIVLRNPDCKIPGWGQLQFQWNRNMANPPTMSHYSRVLQMATFKVMTRMDCCSRYYRNSFRKCMDHLGSKSGLFCHVPKTWGTSVTWGDAGSPILCPHLGANYFIGFHSMGDLKGTIKDNASTPESVMTPGFFFIDFYVKTFQNAYGLPREKHIPMPMSHSQQNTPGLGLVLSILAAASFSPFN